MVTLKNDETCFYTFIYTAVALVFAWPLYLYLITEWYANRNHFVIRNRWPKLSLITVAFTIIIQVLVIIESTFCLRIISCFSIGLWNAVQGLVYYHCFLLYSETMKTREYLDHHNGLGPMLIRDVIGCHQNIGRFILFTVAITSITITICRWYDISPLIYASFSLILLIGVICLVNLIRAKVKDSIGITRECTIQIIINFAMIVLVGFAPRLVPSFIEINLWLGTLGSICYGLSTLFVAHHLIRSGTVTADGSPSTSHPTPMKMISESIQSPDHETCARQASLNQWLEKPLWLFLKDNTKNLSLFIGYLSECFALENMLFLERAIVLHHLIKKYRDMDDMYGVREEDEMIKWALAQPCYKLKFAFLTPIYDAIDTIIMNNCNETDAMKYKRGIVEAMKVIYRQYCCEGGDTEINIGFQHRSNLCQLFEDKTDGEILDQFASYDALLMVFHDVIEEIMTLCQIIYGFQFKAYVKETVIQKDIDVPETQSCDYVE